MMDRSRKFLIDTFVGKAKSPVYFMNKAYDARDENDQPKVRRILAESLELHPRDARLWHEYAKSLSLEDSYALHCLEKAYTLAPGDKHIAMDFASLLVRRKNYKPAEKIYMTILSDEGDSMRLLCAMGHSYQKQKKWPLALACFSRAVELAPNDHIALRRYEEIQTLTGRSVSDTDRRELADRMVRMVESIVCGPAKEDIDNPPAKRP